MRYILRTFCAIGLSAELFQSPLFAAVPGDPQGSGVLVSAVSWLQGTLLGTVATVVAVIAIAAVGFGMLTGRINWRHGAVVVLLHPVWRSQHCRWHPRGGDRRAVLIRRVGQSSP
jgi:type IV secretion system protein VirB2